MRVLTRYLWREIGLAALAVGGALFLIMMANLLARLLSAVAEGSLPSQLLWMMLGFNAIKLLIYVLPVGLFIGVMFALGRMSRDSELSVLRACGYGPAKQTRALLGLAFPVMLLTGFLSLWGYPAVQQVQDQLLASAKSDQVLAQIPTERFIEDASGRAVLYVGGRRKDGYVDVFAFNSALNPANPRQQPGVEAAPFGTLKTAPDGHRYIVLSQGRRIEGQAGATNWSVVDYQTHEILIPGHDDSATNPTKRMQSSWALLHSSVPADQAEFFYRISQMISVWVLVLIAVPLAQNRPRSGRYGRLFWAFLLYALYFNFIALGQNLIKQDTLTLWQGLAIVHGVFLLIWGLLRWAQSGGWRRLLARVRPVPQGGAAHGRA
ncbi:LPS export ABC transporter permease LptF [Halothiobacillus sp. DCM-1]|uniref:LPS export ABC transporter permease LptF n=1 Tax=Halothiobacillus sp. DCM-1 TaxID=3112558 RepID=UPI00324741D9